jgi:predicted metal-dependent hydrolase
MMELNYQIVRSPKRKKLTITVERDRAIIVHAPQETPEATVRRVVDGKRQWLLAKLQHPQKYQDRPHPPGKEVVNGESAPYLGRDYRIEIAETASGEVEFSSFFMVPTSHQGKRREVLRDWYIARAKEKILDRVEQHARELGVTFATARIVDNRYRWGSCTVQNNVNFNWRLIKAPDVRNRLCDRARTRSPHRGQPYVSLLEYYSRKYSHDGKSKGMVKGARAGFGGRNLGCSMGYLCRVGDPNARTVVWTESAMTPSCIRPMTARG